MNIEERVDSICRWNNPGLRAVVLEAITDAIKEEREACKEIAQMYVNLIREVDFPEKGAAELIRNAIMKRADEQPAESEEMK